MLASYIPASSEVDLDQSSFSFDDYTARIGEISSRLQLFIFLNEELKNY